jgi:hypothetical protein
MKTAMSENIESLKVAFVKEVQQDKLLSKRLKALFLIGSVANKQTFSNEFFQDFDIHLFFDYLDIDIEILKRVKALSQKIVSQNINEQTAMEFVITDRPWKMIPKKAINIGIHGTLLNCLDFERRINENYILGLNMFHNSEVLFGALDFPKKTICPEQFLSEVGGVGWLMEQYCRALAALDVQNEAMYPQVIELSYYFGLSPLLHFYYLRKGKVATRKECFTFFVNNDAVPEDLKEAAKFIMKKSVNNSRDCQKILDYSFRIIEFVACRARPECKKETQTFSRQESLIVDENSGLIAEILGYPVSVTQNHFFIQRGNFDQFQGEIQKRFNSSSYLVLDDFVESMSALIEKGESTQIKRPYFWILGENERFFNKIDFPLFNPTLSSLLYSWEKGITTFIQRLLERYLGKEKLESADVLLAELLTSVAYDCYQQIICNRSSGINVFNQGLAMMGIPKGVNALNIEDQYFTYLKRLYSLVEKGRSK